MRDGNDTSGGQGWSQASDGKWYPPESHPAYRPKFAPPSMIPASVQPSPAAPGSWWRKWWWVPVLGGLAAIGAVSNAVDEDNRTVVKSDAVASVWSVVVDAPGTDITREIAQESSFNGNPGEGALFFGVPISLMLEEAG